MLLLLLLVDLPDDQNFPLSTDNPYQYSWRDWILTLLVSAKLDDVILRTG